MGESVQRWHRLSELRGHEHALTALRNAWLRQRVHHAMLFQGPAGVGKTLAARAWTSLMMCEAPKDGDACGTCRGCVKLKGGSHPDVIELEPDGRFIKIEQVREVAAATRFHPHEAQRRIVLVHSAERLREEAANALLKTLEEPTGATNFVLITAHPVQLLPTIRSRCLPLRFGRLSWHQAEQVLCEHGYSGAQASALARLSDGAPGAAAELEQSTVFAERAATVLALSHLDEMPRHKVLLWAADLAGDKETLRSRLTLWIALLRDALVLRATGNSDDVRNIDIDDELGELSRRVDFTTLGAWIECVDKALRRIDGNVNPKLVAESFLLELSESRRAAS